jgi:uncharacterized damage-inducible protein DinB
MSHTLVNHLTYNLWANERLGHLLMAHDDSILNAEQKSSFASITKTIFHVWDAEVIWFTRLKGGTLADWPSKTFTGGKTEMLHGFVKTSTELLQFIKEKGEPFLNQTIAYKNMKGESYENPVEEILFHLVNHGSYHRGQIITMLRGAGVTQVVNTDLINWFREQRKTN